MPDRSPAVVLAVVAVASTLGVSGPGDPGAVDFRSAITIADDEEAFAPVALGDRSFTVVVHKKRLVWPEAASHRFDPDADETAVSFDVRDAEGRVLYTCDVVDDPAEIEPARIRGEGRFSFSYAVHPYRLEGSAGSALMVDWSFLPSAPGSCTTHVVLGIVGDRLVPFGEPFCESFEEPREMSASVWPLRRDERTGDDIFEVRQHTGYFWVMVPVRVSFSRGKLLPVRRCLRLNEAARWVELCEFPVEVYRQPAPEETFVRLFPRPESAATPLHVVVKPDSEVEFLSALVPNLFDERGAWKPGVGEQVPWLKVRVAGKEGWVREDEDLFALGLHPAG